MSNIAGAADPLANLPYLQSARGQQFNEEPKKLQFKDSNFQSVSETKQRRALARDEVQRAIAPARYSGDRSSIGKDGSTAVRGLQAAAKEANALLPSEEEEFNRQMDETIANLKNGNNTNAKSTMSKISLEDDLIRELEQIRASTEPDRDAYSFMGLGLSMETHEKLMKEKVQTFSTLALKRIQTLMEQRMVAVEKEEMVKFKQMQRELRDMLRYYHANEGGIHDICQKLRDYDQKVAVLEEEREGLRERQETIKRFFLELEQEREEEARRAEELRRQAEEDAERRRLKQEEREGRKGYGGKYGYDKYGNELGPDGKPLRRRRSPRRKPKIKGYSDDDVAEEERRKAAELQSRVDDLTAQLREMNRKLRALKNTVLDKKKIIQKSQAEYREKSEEQGEQTRMILKELEKLQSQVFQEKNKRIKVLDALGAEAKKLKRIASKNEVTLQKKMDEREKRKVEVQQYRDSIRSINERLHLVGSETDNSLQETEARFLQSLQDRVAITNEVAGVFTQMNTAFEDEFQCQQCNQNFTEPTVLWRTGKSVCFACAQLTLTEQDEERALGEAKKQAAIANGTLVEEAEDSETNASNRDNDDDDDDYGFTKDEFAPRFQRNYLIDSFISRYEVYSVSLQDMRMSCKLLPMLKHSIKTKLAKHKPNMFDIKNLKKT